MLRLVLACGVLLALILVSAASAAAPPAGKAKREVDPVFRPIDDVPGLPRVLLIGDSISIGYTLPVRDLLKGKANVHRISTNGGPTTKGLESLDVWLGNKTWDVIHFNWGLHDLKYLDERGRPASPDKGKTQVPLDLYEKNLGELVKRLVRTRAKLVWATTTPVPNGAAWRVPDDVARYNAVARKVMVPRRVAIDDLYAFAMPRLARLQLPRNVHFTPVGSKALAEQVAKSILSALGR